MGLDVLRRLIGPAVMVGAGVAGYKLVVEPWWRSWGVDPAEASRELAGDGIIPGAETAETRGITIDAPPASVWPWLVQMGYGRAGWYSYDVIDMKGESAHRILSEHQGLKVGDVMPTHPGGGFVVRELEPERHVVLYMDTELAREQAREAARGHEATPVNLRATGALMEGAQPTEFSATWAFVLEDLHDGRTRLVERFRVHFEDDDDKPWTRWTLPFMGFGAFVMMRRQLIGIRDRVEHAPMPLVVAAA
jgi:hypothetical protein